MSVVIMIIMLCDRSDDNDNYADECDNNDNHADNIGGNDNGDN